MEEDLIMMSSSCSRDELENVPQNLKTKGSCSITEIPAKYLEKYREFVRRNRFALSLAEDSLSRLVLYAPGRFVSLSEEDLDKNKSKINPETLYAIINLWGLFNDTIYHGLGNGNGLTVGSIHGSSENNLIENRTTRTRRRIRTKVILLLRSILSVVECLAPSLEVAAYSRNIRSASASISNNRHDYRGKGHERHLNALSMSSNIEKTKFICRIGIMILNYYEEIQSSEAAKDKAIDILSRIGIIHEGGLLNPNEHVSHAKDEHARVKKLLYVGKRTGRQVRYNTNQIHNAIPLTASVSPRTKIGFTVMGDLLHVLRPLYYVQTSLCHENIGGKHGRQGMIKSWIVSLAMDLLSQRLIYAGKTVQKGKNGCVVNISSESTKEEMYHRKMRLTLYLLRSPAWNMATYPLAEKISRIVALVPLLGAPLVDYLMSVLNYWQKWHFMLEA